MTRFLIVRHGQTDWNVLKRVQGHTNIPLNEEGLRQAQKLATRLQSESIAHIYSSHLDRAKATAQMIAQYHSDVPFTVTEDLAEYMMGIIEGLTVDEAHAKYGTDFWDDDVERVRLGMHTKSSYHERFRQLIPKWCQAHPNHSIVLATHGGTKRAILNAFDLSDEDRATILANWSENCSLSIVEVDDQGKAQLILCSCTKHLEK